MLALKLTTLRTNGQHLTVPNTVKPRNSRDKVNLAASDSRNWKGAGMAERVVW
jgi:hypothetical protein